MNARTTNGRGPTRGQVMQAPGGNNPEVSSDSLAISLTRADIDQQISTAHAYPRSIAQVQKRILELSTLDEETAKEMIYSRPQGGDVIQGPSIRFAELLLSAWGNCRVASRTVHEDRTFVEAEGIFHDLETNVAQVARVRRRIVTRSGARYSDDLIITTANAAAAIARRNAILGGVPKPLWRGAIQEVEKLIRGEAKTLDARRSALVGYLKGKGIEAARIYKTLKVGGLPDITLDHMVTLHGLAQAMKDGDASIDELFPADEPAAALASKVQNEGGEGFNRDQVRREMTGGESATDDQQDTGGGAADQTTHDPVTGEVTGEATGDATDQQPATSGGDTGEVSGAVGGDDAAAAGADDGADDQGEGDAGGEGATDEPAQSEEDADGGDAAAVDKAEQNDASAAEADEGGQEDASPSRAARALGQEPEEEEQDQAPAVPMTGAFAAFDAKCAGADSWLIAKQAMAELARTEDWGNATADEQAAARASGWAHVERIKKEKRDPIDPGEDATAFRMWLEFCTDGDAIVGVLRTLKRQPAWARLKPEQQASIETAAENRINLLGAGG